MDEKKLIKCPVCNGMISKRAKTCPHCGEPKPNELEWYVYVIAYGGILIFFGSCAWFLGQLIEWVRDILDF